MKSLIIPLKQVQVKKEEIEVFCYSHKIHENQELYSNEHAKRMSFFKDVKSTSSCQSSSSKMIQLNDMSTASHSCISKQDEANHHFSHYLKHFSHNPQLQQAEEREAIVSLLPIRKQQKLSIMPYSKLVQSLNGANIIKMNKNFIEEWIDFMEKYECQNIGLNMTNKQQQQQQHKNLNNYEQERRMFETSSKKNSKAHSKFNHSINIKDIIPQFPIPDFVQELILNKFCLYIQSSYKVLKSNDLEKQNSSIEMNIFNLIFNRQSQSSHNSTLNSMQNDNSYSASSNILNSNGTKKFMEAESSGSLKDQKKYHFNMSKYFMLFMLELFRQEHLGALQNLPEYIIADIEQIVTQIQTISKKNNSSKTNYYNHYHYDVLFLQINDQTKNTILRNQKLFEMHQQVFRIANLNCQLSIQRVNILKQYMTSLVLSQLAVLKGKLKLISTPILQSKSIDISKATLEDINSKIDYLYRVEQGILELNLGKTINRF